MNDLSHEDVGREGKEHTSRAKDPAIVKESQKPIRWLSGIPLLIAIILVFLFVVLWLRNYNKKVEADKAAAAMVAATNTPPVAMVERKVEALVPMYDGYTPCSVPIDYKFELDTQGDPIDLKFPGIKDPVQYSGKGKGPKVPSSRDIGEVKITSSNQIVRVRIWKVVSIRP